MSSSPQLREATHASILAATRRLFAHGGYSGFSMRKLACEMHCAVGTLYLYFPGKDDLLRELADQSFSRLIRSLEALNDRHRAGNPLVLLKKALYTYIQFARGNASDYRLVCLIYQEHPSSIDAVLAVLRSIIHRCISEGYLRGVELNVTADALWAIIHGTASLPRDIAPAAVEQLITSALEGLTSFRAAAKAYGT